MHRSDPPDPAIEQAAADWFARRDRGLTSAEQDGYLQWLRENEAHGRAIAALEQNWLRLDALRDWRPGHSATPNPDLLAPHRARRWWGAVLLAAAACAALGVWVGHRPAEPPSARQVLVHRGPEKVTLEDGSLVELNSGAKLEVKFTAAERHVRLLKGDAHFTVAKNPARPFIVTTGIITVRAIGTAFAVLTGTQKTSVLVTEGRVGLAAGPEDPSTASSRRDNVQAVAGQEVDLDLAATGAKRFNVRELTPTQMDQALSWRALRLEFQDSPLREVVAELNRFNARKLSVADDLTGEILIAGSFRADNLDAFVRLLDAGFNVAAERTDDEIILRRRR